MIVSIDVRESFRKRKGNVLVLYYCSLNECNPVKRKVELL